MSILYCSIRMVRRDNYRLKAARLSEDTVFKNMTRLPIDDLPSVMLHIVLMLQCCQNLSLYPFELRELC